MHLVSPKKKAKLDAVRQELGALELAGPWLLMGEGSRFLVPTLIALGAKPLLATLEEDHLPSFPEASFAGAVVLDVLEHLDNDQTFLRSLRCILQPDAHFILTVPALDSKGRLRYLREAVGITSGLHGHKRAGYGLEKLARKLRLADFEVLSASHFCGPLTELMDILGNFCLSHWTKGKEPGALSGPGLANLGRQTWQGKVFWAAYVLVYPFLWLLYKWDAWRAQTGGAGLLVVAKAQDRGSRKSHL